MADLLDYLKWRGDLSFSQVPLNPIDALIFSTLSYIGYDGVLTEEIQEQMTLRQAAEQFFALPDQEDRIRVKKDIPFLQAAAETERFGQTKVGFYRSILEPEEEKQFAAITYWLDDGKAVVVFRGTDLTLAGWKEDFNMTFYESIPSQLEAVRYVDEFALSQLEDFYLAGHSKGGNLAVYAAAKCDSRVRGRIVEIHNQDGPGFTETLMGDEGYLAMVPKIKTFIPQSSVVGMLLEHEEPYSVIKSKQIGLMQHDPYSWEVEVKDFVYVEERSSDSKIIDKALKTWLEGMTLEERSDFVDAVYDVLTSGGVSHTKELIQIKNWRKFVKTLSGDGKKRKLIAGELMALMRSVKQAQQENKD